MKKGSWQLVLVIAVIAVITVTVRLIALDKVPVHLSNDEISIAYDAYSILRTGRDEHNHYLPLSFQSHNTYKAPLLIYLATISNLFMGNNEYSVRIPSVILGSLTVLVLGLLVWEMTKSKILALVSGGILAITPWHIYTSRMALESNVALFFLVTGVYFFMRGQKNNWLLIVSMISFGLSIWGYHTEWGLTPIIIAILGLIYYKKINNKGFLSISWAVFLLIAAPIFLDFVVRLGTNARANTETLLKDPYFVNLIKNHQFNFWQEIVVILKLFLGNYSDYFNLRYLFFDGLNLFPVYQIFRVGLFLPVWLPLFFIGLAELKSEIKDHYKFIYGWLIVSPLVPAFTHGGLNMMRNLATVIPMTIIISVGVIRITKWRNGWKWGILIFGLTAVSFRQFLSLYFRDFPIQSGENYQYGYKQVAEFIGEHYGEYQKIIVDPKFGDNKIYDGVPHLYLSYFTNLDPQKMLERVEINGGLYFDKYEIREIDWREETVDKSTLYAVPEANIPADNKALIILKKINLPNQKTGFEILGQ